MERKARRRRLTALLGALALISGGVTLAATAIATPAKANVGAAICTSPSASACMNRNGGGSANGTKIIEWHNDLDNNEDFIFANLTSWCNGGHVTPICPFTVGSGLNTRYQGDQIVSIYSTGTGKCIGADGTWTAAILNLCLPNGGAFVKSATNGTFLIDVGVSNHFYGLFGTYNQPFWLIAPDGYGAQLSFANNPINSWRCYGSGSCG
jgi:hypothetical protein